ncbi:Metallo-dependent phosphatase-like protein [Echria macrotheca]|uniref:Metallo-dependent phosphatase-like protein n=1 Tax=Echria macrotheca TaxID=438768 RepID=A0AAJ0B2E1_9PEZI|nr:Metallo-dependent phosphatase-like protein [Echria macrotheca]
MASLRDLLLWAALGFGAAIPGVAAHEDHLVSRRMTKRFVDDNGHYNISFYHINDVHAHLDEFSSSGTDCPDKTKGCRGGYARVRSVLKETRPDHPDSLFLNAGDEFQGTMFFTFYGGEKIAETLNQMGFDGMTLGNHEWDKGDDVLGDFLNNLTFPIISANVHSDNEKLNKTIKPYHIYEQYELAVIGVTTDTTPSISQPGAGTTFSDPVQAVQNTIDHIRATTNIKRIAALTHIGYEEDQRLARETTGLHLIMGGHSHTKLGSEPGSEGPYPTIVTNKNGDEVFVVTAWRWGEYLGYIDVTYDADGKILEYHGAPINLSNKTAQDPELQAQITEWRKPFEEYAARVVGYSNVVLEQSNCVTEECVLGDFMADAMLQYRLNNTSPSSSARPDFALLNGGGVRATIDIGPITRGEVLTAFPFGNAVVDVVMSGDSLWKSLEGIVSGTSQVNGRPVPSFLQVSSGIVVRYNPAASAGSKLVSVDIGGKPLDRAAEYRIVTVDFVATGGDNYFDPPFRDIIALDTLDEVLIRHIGAMSPVEATLGGRLVKGSKCTSRTKKRQV